MEKIRAALVGATGYTGNELLRILLPSREVEFTTLTSETHQGKRIADVCPQLSSFSSHTLVSFSEEIWENNDVVFLALPHGEAQERIKTDRQLPRIIDLSGDFRLKNLEEFREFYGFDHKNPSLVDGFVYGLPELNREAIKKSRFVSNPGCFASASILGLIPLTEGNHILHAFISGFTGSSGIGRQPKIGAHHPVRNHNIKAYKVGDHQHLPEIQQALNFRSIEFVPHSAPLTRGIFLSVFVELKEKLNPRDLDSIYNERYDSEPFIRIRKNVELAEVTGSNMCDISVKLISSNYAHISVAHDNLVKGAAGTAVQNLNIMFGRDETADLDHLLPLYP